MKAAPLRERQRELTRNAILDAYLELAHVDGASAISIPAVARTAGVSPRTIYRYFPTKGELATAAALRMSTEALAGDDMYASTTSNLGDNLKRLWFGLNEQLPAVIAEHATPAGRDIRRTRLDMARAAVRDRIDAHGPLARGRISHRDPRRKPRDRRRPQGGEMTNEQDRTLRRAAYGLIAGFVLHNSDHARRGLDDISEAVVWAGTLLLVIASVAVTLILTRHWLSAAVAAVVGWTVVVGVSSAHLLPDWGPLSDALPGSGLGLITWLAVFSEIVAGAWLGWVGLQVLRSRDFLIRPAVPAI